MAPAESGKGRTRTTREQIPVTRDREKFDAAEANADKAHKLKRVILRRRARARGFELRHSDYGFSLIDSSRNRVDGRSDMTLADVEKYLDGAVD